MMRFYCFLLLLFSLGCGNQKQDTRDVLTGKWIILYPDHKLTSRAERKVYGKYQDSLISLYGLKLIKLESDGHFVEIDSIQPRGAKWDLQDSVFRVQEGGKGFNPFNTTFTDLENDTLKLTQFLALEDEKIKVVWHLKKINDDTKEAALFGAEANSWRKVPTAPESAGAMRKRLAAMLDYYSDYYALVGKESIYFSQARVPLPFRYYQHAMGIQEEFRPDFIRLFYNQDDVSRAHVLLEQTISANSFPRGDNFVTEYGLFLKKLAVWMKEK